MDRHSLEVYTFNLDEADIKRERHKARDMRKSQWWKRCCAKGVCHYCGRPTLPGELTMDHIVPISRGGKSTKGNTVPCCKECNTNKKHLLPMEWEQYLKGVQ
ncbi:MAG TPA: HNH endonuclease [Desulfobacterales bacterium]|nr:HNH endonuclease [Desulfobacterales bacterium]